MTLQQRIFIFSIFTMVAALTVAGLVSYFEFSEQHRFALEHSSQVEKVNPAWEALEIVLFTGGCTLVIVVAGAFLLTSTVIRPISQLTTVLENTNVDNLLDPVKGHGSGDELDRLTTVFNLMKKRLSLSFTQSREFTLYASHELKTPLAIMHSTLEQMISAESSVTNKDRLGSILEETQRLAAIVEQLSFLAKADAGLLMFQKLKIDLDQIVSDSVDDIALLAAVKNISVTCECEHLAILGERMRLRQLFLILADNAIKYNRENGRILIQLKKQDNRALLQISNDGVLLDASLHERIFDRFYRGDISHNGEVEGSGLGLSIAKSIVEAHQGTIFFDVSPEGLNRISISIPLIDDAKTLF
jgi:signal transduction histidine kinase